MRRKPLFPPPKDESTGRPLKHRGRPGKDFTTLNGVLRLKRTVRQKTGEPAVVRGDQLVDAADEVISLGVREIVCLLDESGVSFRTTADNLKRVAGIHLSHETVRTIVEDEGRAVLAAEKAGTLPAAWSAEDATVEDSTRTRVYMGADGVKVPTVTHACKLARRETVKRNRKLRGKKCRPLPRLKPGADQAWKECKVVQYYDQNGRRHVSAAIADAEDAGRRMRRQGAAIGLSRADEKLGVFDGADWIRNQVERQSLPLDGLLLDFFHLAENVHTCRRVVFGDSDDPAGEGMIWAGELLHAVKTGGFDAFRERVLDLRSRVRRNRRKKAAVDRLLEYASDRRGMLDYPEWVAAGRDIGSGATESTCKGVTRRLKGRGRRWDLDNSDGISTLSALRLSNRWDLWWKMRLAA